MLLIQNGTLHTMEDNSPVKADVLIRDGKIEKIGQRIRLDKDVEIINAEGLHIYPGFIDAHSHIGIAEEQTTAQTDCSNEATNPVTPFIRAIDGINPMDSAFHNALAAGVTGVMVGPGSSNPIGGQFAFIKTYGRCVDDMVVLSPAAIKIALGENPISTYGLNGNMPATRMGTAYVIREELFRVKQYLQKGDEEKDYRMESYRELFTGKIPLKAHVHRTDDIFTAIRIAKEFGLGLTLDHCTEGHLIAEEIAESGYPAIVGPSLASRTKDEVSLSDFKTAGILRKAGVTVALTTDHPVSLIQSLPLCAGLAVKAGLDMEEGYKSITINPAIICGVEKRVGSLEVGKDADIAIFDGNPMEVFTQTLYTIIDGQIIYDKEGKYTPENCN